MKALLICHSVKSVLGPSVGVAGWEVTSVWFLPHWLQEGSQEVVCVQEASALHAAQCVCWVLGTLLCDKVLTLSCLLPLPAAPRGSAEGTSNRQVSVCLWSSQGLV